MAIDKGSRYEYADISYFKDSMGDQHPVLRYYFDDIGTIKYQVYTWQENDRLDLIASKFYNNSKLWWIILEHNPEVLDPTNIPAGYGLRIPNVY